MQPVGPGVGDRPVVLAAGAPGPGDELLDPRPGDATAVSWTLECAATAGPAGTDVTGPYVQGRPGARFVYLSWGTVDDAGAFTMFRRAKLLLDAVPADVLDAGVRAVVAPGGSIRDEEVVAAARAAGATMYVTGTRHFAH